MSHNCGSERWLSVELAFYICLRICSNGRLLLGLRSRSRNGLATRQLLAKVVYSESTLARLPHEAQYKQKTLHNPRSSVRRPTRPVRPRSTMFTSSTLCQPITAEGFRIDAPNSQIGHHQNRPRRLDTHHRDAQCSNKFEFPCRVDLWCVLDHCERGRGQAKEPSPELDRVWRVDLKRGCGD